MIKNLKRIRTGVKALIVHEKKILIISENVIRDGKNIIINDFPGGGIEFGEHLDIALKREVKEEVNLNIDVQKVIGAWEFVLDSHHDASKAKVQIVCIGYQCKVIGELKIDLTKNPAQEDIFDYKWYTKEEILTQGKALLKHRGMIEAVANLDI